MMHYFPKPYPDELLYSVLARYCIQSGNLNTINNTEDIFGSSNRNVFLSPELPGNIDMLISNLPEGAKYTADRFIYDNTLFSYVASFLPEDRAREVYEIMQAGQSSIIYNKAGLVSGSIKSNKMFRFCPHCMEDDMQTYGEAYWHRSHQVTGAFMCHLHKEAIYDSLVPLRGNYKQNYISASFDVCRIESAILYNDETIEKLIWIAEDIYNILNRPFEYQLLMKKKYLYMERLIEKNIANMNSMIHQKRLRNELIDFWGTEVLELLQSPIEINKECQWLNVLIWENENISLPIRHLILMRFLGIEIDDFSVDLPTNSTHKEIWNGKLLELANKKISIRKIARLLDSTPRTVRKQMLKMGIESYWESKNVEHSDIQYSGTVECKEKLDEAKEEWLIVETENPNISRNQLRKLKPALYNRLVRYDREWLYANSQTKGAINNNTYWEQRDKELLIQVHEIVKSMHQGKPEQVQWLNIGGRLGINGWFGKNRDRIPLVKEYLDAHVESLQNFHVRKIKWAIIELEIENETITKNKLLETAGVKPWYIDNIRDRVRQLLSETGYDVSLID
ncbi:MAG: TnsD family Tn7-like transposition protein [Mobilitalea sp.]